MISFACSRVDTSLVSGQKHSMTLYKRPSNQNSRRKSWSDIVVGYNVHQCTQQLKLSVGGKLSFKNTNTMPFMYVHIYMLR